MHSRPKVSTSCLRKVLVRCYPISRLRCDTLRSANGADILGLRLNRFLYSYIGSKITASLSYITDRRERKNGKGKAEQDALSLPLPPVPPLVGLIHVSTKLVLILWQVQQHFTILKEQNVEVRMFQKFSTCGPRAAYELCPAYIFT
jgi:hypothetical protein